MNSLEFINSEIEKLEQWLMIVKANGALKYNLKYFQQIKSELVALEILKSKLYLPEENDCDTLDDGSKVYMIYAKGVWSEEEYKALKEVLNEKSN